MAATTLVIGTVKENSRTVWLHDGWELTRMPAGACVTPEGLQSFAREWRAATVPGTIAGSLGHDINAPGDYDADDWWYTLSFKTPADFRGGRQRLLFEGLATLAQVWLNGTPILSSRNM